MNDLQKNLGMKRLRRILAGTGLFFLVASLNAYADYAEDLRRQADQIQKDHSRIDADYFRDMGVVARKVDDASMQDLTVDIVRTRLLGKAEAYVRQELSEINSLYGKDSVTASRRLEQLTHIERYFQPSEDFLRTASGREIASQVTRDRTNAKGMLKDYCSDQALVNGLTALLETSSFYTNSLSEIEAARAILEELQCCFGWQRELHFQREKPFQTDYEEGKLTEEGNLHLESSAGDGSEARWTGEWIYRYTGREGQGKGLSQAVLIYHKGEDHASLKITAGRVTSSGRMNFPNALAGEERTYEIMRNPVNPQLSFFETLMDLTGCQKKK